MFACEVVRMIGGYGDGSKMEEERGLVYGGNVAMIAVPTTHFLVGKIDGLIQNK